MKKSNRALIGIILMLSAAFFTGAIFDKSEAKLNVIKAGVDEKGHPVCVNKSQVYLFKKNETEKTITFFYHDPSSEEATVRKTFSEVEVLNKYWDDLLKSW
tara:strand:+ start:372 stop:674 length:303 start_codon:yes stop_codon:yes gene_type:complete